MRSKSDKPGIQNRTKPTNRLNRRTMVAFDELFIPLPAFQIAICREHGSAVTAKSVIRHVGSQHRHLAAQVRQRIAEEAAALRDSGLLAADTHGIRFPGEVVAAIDGLPVWTDGKKCMQCGHIRRTREDIQKHCRSEHGWVNPRGRGGKPGARPAGGLGEAWVDGVHCQRFGQDSMLQRLFEVVPAAAAAADHSNGDAQGSQHREGGEDRAKRDQEAVRAVFEAAASAIKEKDKAAAAGDAGCREGNGHTTQESVTTTCVVLYTMCCAPAPRQSQVVIVALASSDQLLGFVV